VTAAESVAYIYGLGTELRPGRKFDLTTITALLEALDHPERRFASVHVAGTNGKGSVCAMVECAARAAGWRTGLYTSPHLQRFQERIRIAGDEIDDAALGTAATRVREAAERLETEGKLARPPAFFEAATAVGFCAFAAAGVELAVVEVGLGGRLDATNVIMPKLAVITALGMDHEAYLGSSLGEIAGEKAGILKPGVGAAISAPQLPEARAVLRATAEAAGVGLEFVERAAIEAAPRTRLLGDHQRENAAVAAAVCRGLEAHGFAVPEAAVAAGLENVRWPGRLEQISSAPDVFLDGAHNPLAARALAAYLDQRGGEPPVLIFGAMRDKAVEEICEALFPRARAVVLTAPRQARALAPEALAGACGSFARRCEIAADYRAALARARKIAAEAPPTTAIFVTGSLYLVGEAREASA